MNPSCALTAAEAAAEAPAQVTEGGTGIDAFVELNRRFISPLVTTHHGHQPEIELTGETEPTGIWPMEDVLVWTREGYRLRGTGHYRETYTKVAGQWKIASLKLSQLYVHLEKIEPLV